jgi:signal transduction histidine kinase/CheY-like chemotaxis protein
MSMSAASESSEGIEAEVSATVSSRANALFWGGAKRAGASAGVLCGLLLLGTDAAVESPLVGAWVAALVASYGTRFAFARAYLALGPGARQALRAQWRRRAIWLASTAGAVWGVGFPLMWHLATDRERAFVGIIFAGLVAASSAALSAIQPALLGFILPLWLGLFMGLAMTAKDRLDAALAAASLVLLPLLRRGTQVMHDEFERTIHLMHSKDRLTKDLEAARDAALAAARARSDFVSMMSHELRTPLNGVVGLTTLLLDTPLDPDQRELAKGAHTSAQMLVGLIDGVLDLSKIDAGRLELDCTDFDLNLELETLRTVLALRAREKGLSFCIEVNGTVPPAVRGDWFRLRQVLVNLIGNALKFTERGQVTVRVQVQGGRPGPVRVRFEVADTGPGLSREQQARLFQPFVQADRSIARRFGGTGLGLSISHRLVALMGGALEVLSVDGQGATFSFEVSLEVGAEPRPGPAPMPVRRSGRVAVCDDNDINLVVATRLLQRLGFEVVAARGGTELVRLAATRGPFDLVVLDLQMPDLDGYQTLAALRDAGVRGPAMALTANASMVERERALASGFSWFLTKPLQVSALTAALDELGGSSGGAQAQTAPPMDTAGDSSRQVEGARPVLQR